MNRRTPTVSSDNQTRFAITCARGKACDPSFFYVPYTPGGASPLCKLVDKNKASFSSLANAISSVRIRIDENWKPAARPDGGERKQPPKPTSEAAPGALFFVGGEPDGQLVFNPEDDAERAAVTAVDVQVPQAAGHLVQAWQPRPPTVVAREVMPFPAHLDIFGVLRRQAPHP